MRGFLRSIFALAALAATARTVQAQKLRHSDAEGRDRRCQAAMYPKELPALAAIGDSVALTGWAATTTPPDSGDLVLSLLFDRSGRLIHLRQVEPSDSTSPHALPSASLIHGQASGKTDWAIRLRVSPAAGRPVVVERSVYCPPERAGPSSLGRSTATVHITSGDRLPALGARGRIRMEAKLDISETGAVTSVELTRGSGISQLDGDWVGQLRMTRYLPALVDGIPIASWMNTSGTKLRL